MRKIHHKMELKETCQMCGRHFIMNWFDKFEANGRSETMWEDKYCTECQTKRNGGLPLLSLPDYNEIARLKITRREYYERMGYKNLIPKH